jgi:hypothetical protein
MALQFIMLRALSDEVQDKRFRPGTSQGGEMIEEVKEIFCNLKAAHKKKGNRAMLRFITDDRGGEKIGVYAVGNDLYRTGVHALRHLLQAWRIGHHGDTSPEDEPPQWRQ